MARSPRTRFAAPFVVIVGTVGCSSERSPTDPRQPAPSQSWSVRRDGDRCYATQHIECPPPTVATCNPPAPMNMPCPPDAPPSFKVVSADGKTCFMADGKVAVTCPSYEPIAPPPPPPPAVDAAVVALAARRWDIARRPDGSCWVEDDPCSRLQLAPGAPIPPCNPPPPTRIACPDPSVVAIVETTPGTCETASGACDPGVKCNPPAPRPIDCPRF